MKNINNTLMALAAVTILSAPSIANAQTPPSQPPTQPTEQQQAAVQAPRTASVSGSLLSVDNEKMKLTIKDSLGTEHTFKYNPQTEVIGATAGVAGLATLAGTDVMVHYKSDSSDRAMSDSPAKNDEKKTRIATKIEVVTKK